MHSTVSHSCIFILCAWLNPKTHTVPEGFRSGLSFDLFAPAGSFGPTSQSLLWPCDVLLPVVLTRSPQPHTWHTTRKYTPIRCCWYHKKATQNLHLAVVTVALRYFRRRTRLGVSS